MIKEKEKAEKEREERKRKQKKTEFLLKEISFNFSPINFI